MTRLPRPVRRAVPAVVACALVAAGCGTGTTTPPPQPRTPSASPGSRAAAGFPTDQDVPVLAAAKAFTQTVTTYDHTKLADQRTAVLPLVGEPLKTQLSQSLADGGDFAKAVTGDGRDARGTVLDLGLVSRVGDRAVVVLFVDQQITSASGNGTVRLRERVTLGRTRAGTWLATKIETL